MIHNACKCFQCFAKAHSTLYTPQDYFASIIFPLFKEHLDKLKKWARPLGASFHYFLLILPLSFLSFYTHPFLSPSPLFFFFCLSALSFFFFFVSLLFLLSLSLFFLNIYKYIYMCIYIYIYIKCILSHSLFFFFFIYLPLFFLSFLSFYAFIL